MVTWTDADIKKYFENDQVFLDNYFGAEFLNSDTAREKGYNRNSNAFRLITISEVREILKEITKLTPNFIDHRSPRWRTNFPIMITGETDSNNKIKKSNGEPFFGLAVIDNELCVLTNVKMQNSQTTDDKYIYLNKVTIADLKDPNNYLHQHLKSINDKKNTIEQGPIMTPKDRFNHKTTSTDSYMGEVSLNQILYGPPGTGKTYNTVNNALYALGKFIEEDVERTQLKQEFDSNVKKGRIVFTTFHQSYAYEDFIEGIRVRTEDGKICYEIQNGTFKQLARKALFFKASGKSNDEVNDSFEKASDFYACTLDEELKKWISGESLKEVAHENDEKELIRQLINNDSSILNLIHEKSDENTPKFVLIIDEINRGNISKILGELITLIEDTKRSGSRDSLPVMLPSSRENFKVPDNLYIIGTMNTSDRSLATLDIALRRRFDFIEMMPQADFLNGINISGIDLKRWFEELNKKIQVERGREFTIGHAFFAPLKEKEPAPTIHDLANIMRRKILPLLDEYFFEDWEGIRSVLGDSESNSPNNFVHKDLIANKKLYQWNPSALTSPQAYKKLYEKNNVQGDQAPVGQ